MIRSVCTGPSKDQYMDAGGAAHEPFGTSGNRRWAFRGDQKPLASLLVRAEVAGVSSAGSIEFYPSLDRYTGLSLDQYIGFIPVFEILVKCAYWE